MKTKYVIVLLILGLSAAVVAANPNILTFDSWGTGHWYNDRNEERTREISGNDATWNTISYPNPWVIEVTNPTLQYDSKTEVYNNGEQITIVQGGATITITANVTTTLTVTPAE